MFIDEPAPSPVRDAMYEEDVDQYGIVWDLTRLWAWHPEASSRFFSLIGDVGNAANLSMRDRGFLVAATASAIGNSSCGLAWGQRLSEATDAETAVGVLAGSEPESLTDRDRALAIWARLVADDAASTTSQDVATLRDVGLDDEEIFNATLYVAFRIAYSTLNDALGASLNHEVVDGYDPAVVSAVDFGRPPA